jgi:outer membrane lipoprotein carrier protein
MKSIVPFLTLIAIVWSASLLQGADPAPRASEADGGTATTQRTDTREALPVASLELLAQVQKRLRTIKSVEANFVEEKHLALLDHNVTIRGSFGLQKPDSMIWIVREPHEAAQYALRLRGEELSQWDEETKNVQVVHLAGDPAFKSVSAQLQAWFLGNYEALNQSWDVYVAGDKPLSLRFVPRATTFVAKHMKSIEVTFNADGTNTDRMSVVETGGDRMTFTFSNVQTNQPIKEEDWKIPPK